jgi:HNH endonuclease
VARGRPWQERLWALIVKAPGDRCWEFRGHVCKTTGYGQLWHDGQARRAHRLAYKSANPEVDIEGLVLLHTCDNRRCCRPSHLQPGTQRENVEDMVRKGRTTVWALRVRRSA